MRPRPAAISSAPRAPGGDHPSRAPPASEAEAAAAAAQLWGGSLLREMDGSAESSLDAWGVALLDETDTRILLETGESAAPPGGARALPTEPGGRRSGSQRVWAWVPAGIQARVGEAACVLIQAI